MEDIKSLLAKAEESLAAANSAVSEAEYQLHLLSEIVNAEPPPDGVPPRSNRKRIEDRLWNPQIVA